jgi:hypothetical protein
MRVSEAKYANTSSKSSFGRGSPRTASIQSNVSFSSSGFLGGIVMFLQAVTGCNVRSGKLIDVVVSELGIEMIHIYYLVHARKLIRLVI